MFGIEKDEYLSKLANTHISISTMKKGNVICADSIERKTIDNKDIPFKLDGEFDIVLANPPFGAKIKIGTEETKKNFELAHVWKKEKGKDYFHKTEKIVKNPSPQILFLELCIKLLKPGGKMGLVVPESMLSSSSQGSVVQFLMDKMNLKAIVGMPENLFKTSGKGGTHTKTCLLVAVKKPNSLKEKSFFMAEAKWCGHDSRGNYIPKNDLPKTLENFLHKNYKELNKDNLGYYVNENDVISNILAPRYYNPESRNEMKKLRETHDLLCLGDLVNEGVIKIETGDEVGKLAYGTETPFVRTSRYF